MTIPQNQASVDITVTPTDDSVTEGIESVSVSVQPGSSYAIGNPGNAEVRILDDETNLVPIASIVAPPGGTVIAAVGAPLSLEGAVVDDDGSCLGGGDKQGCQKTDHKGSRDSHTAVTAGRRHFLTACAPGASGGLIKD